jgi:alginate O-acetyltransferase complex protein AlgI
VHIFSPPLRATVRAAHRASPERPKVVQFNSLTFVAFFTVVTACHYALRSWNSRKWLLVVASFLFYAAWNPLFVLLLGFSTIVDWFLARQIGAAERAAAKRALLVCSLTINLGVLGYFKYGTLLLDTFVRVTAAAGITYVPPELDIALPVGISFYTFQTLSYTLDVYRGEFRPRYSLLDFALFVGFFPQLVAGPIVRARDFLPQCDKPKRFSGDAFGWGCALVVFGLFAKVALADSTLAPVADAVFEAPTAVGTFDAWLGVFAFSGQILLDFSGYSLCAIGAALCLGFELPDNFRAPYAAVGFSDFWRRWHISLSTWLRDYLYIALGGNRGSSARVSANLAFTMVLGGLWHGASWMFVIWGGLHGAYLMIEYAVRRAVGPDFRIQSSLAAFALGLMTFVAVSVTWVFFRAPDLDTAGALLRALFVAPGTGAVALADEAPVVLATLGALLAWHWASRTKHLGELFSCWPAPARVGALVVAMLGILWSSGGDKDAFIYFQF